MHQIEAQQAQHCVRGQVQGLGHDSDAAASNSARRVHGEHCRRPTTTGEKEDVHREHLHVARCDNCVLFTATSNHLKPSKTDLNILKHRQQPKTIRNRVTHPSTTQHSLKKKNNLDKYKQAETN